MEKKDINGPPSLGDATVTVGSSPATEEEGHADAEPSLSRVLGKWELTAAWIGLLLVSMTNYLDVVAVSVFYTYALSEFSRVSIEGALATCVGVATIAIQGPLAVLVNHVQPLVVFISAISLSILGLVMIAAAPNVSCFIPGYVFCSIGLMTSKFMVLYLGAELSSIRYRGLSMAAVNAPSIISLLAGSHMAEAMLDTIGWRWGTGIWAALIPVAAIMLLVILFISERRLKVLRGTGRPSAKQVWRVLQEQDLIGITLLISGTAMLLLPIPLETRGPSKYSEPKNLVPTIIGGLLLVGLFVWERKFAKSPLFPTLMFQNSSILAALACNTMQYFATVMVTAYLYVFLVVSSNASVSTATMISYLCNVVAPFMAIWYGFASAYFKNNKWLYSIANAFTVLGLGLLYAFHEPLKNEGALIVSLVLYGIGFGGLLNVIQLIQSLSTPKDVPIVTALFFLTANIGGSIGGAVCGGMWTVLLPRNLRQALPANLKPDASAIMQSVVEATKYAVGTEERTQIISAYIRTYGYLLIVGLVLAAISFLFSLLIRSNPVEDEPTMAEKDEGKD